jgi:hypothetical protein
LLSCTPPPAAGAGTLRRLPAALLSTAAPRSPAWRRLAADTPRAGPRPRRSPAWGLQAWSEYIMIGIFASDMVGPRACP